MRKIALIPVHNEEATPTSVVTVIQLYRSQAAMRDVLVNGALGLWAYLRRAMNLKVGGRRAASRAELPRELS